MTALNRVSQLSWRRRHGYEARSNKSATVGVEWLSAGRIFQIMRKDFQARVQEFQTGRHEIQYPEAGNPNRTFALTPVVSNGCYHLQLTFRGLRSSLEKAGPSWPPWHTERGAIRSGAYPNSNPRYRASGKRMSPFQIERVFSGVAGGGAGTRRGPTKERAVRRPRRSHARRAAAPISIRPGLLTSA